MISNLLLECQSWDRYKPVNTLLAMALVKRGYPARDSRPRPRELNSPRPTKIAQQGATLLLGGRPSHSKSFHTGGWTRLFSVIWGRGEVQGTMAASAGSRSPRETLSGTKGKPNLGQPYFDTAYESCKSQPLSLQ